MFKKSSIIALLFLLVSCNSPKDADTMAPHSSTGSTTETEEQPVIVSTVKGKYEDLPQERKDEIKQMVDVIVLYIIKKGLPESGSGELSEEDKKKFFNEELILGIDEEIVPAYPHVDFSGMKKTILGQ